MRGTDTVSTVLCSFKLSLTSVTISTPAVSTSPVVGVSVISVIVVSERSDAVGSFSGVAESSTEVAMSSTGVSGVVSGSVEVAMDSTGVPGLAQSSGPVTIGSTGIPYVASDAAECESPVCMLTSCELSAGMLIVEAAV